MEEKLKKLGFTNIEQIGKGSFGLIYKVQSEDKIEAVKIVQHRNYEKNGINNLQELDILCRFKHPYLINANYFLNMEDFTIISLPLAECDLFEYLSKASKNHILIPLQNKLSILHNVILGLEMLHRFNILHLDIKPENVLIRNNKALLTDFGYALKVPNVKLGIKTKLTRISFVFKPFDVLIPDIDGFYHYNDKTDIWSYGVMFLIVISLENVFTIDDVSNINEYINKYKIIFSSQKFIKQYLRVLDEKHREIIYDLIKNILIFDQARRYDVIDILQHALFKDFQYQDGMVLLVETIDYEFKYPIINFIKIIDNEALQFYENESTEIIFLAYDLLYNCFIDFQYYEKDDNKKHDLALTCIWLAHKYITGAARDIIRVNDILKMENIILKILSGNIYNTLIYPLAKNINQLIEFYQEYILSGNHNKYFSINKDYFLNHCTDENDNDEMNKFCSIKDFFAAVEKFKGSGSSEAISVVNSFDSVKTMSINSDKKRTVSDTDILSIF